MLRELSSFKLLQLNVDRLVLGFCGGRLQLQVHVHDCLSFLARSFGPELLASLLDAQSLDLADNVSDTSEGMRVGLTSGG